MSLPETTHCFQFSNGLAIQQWFSSYYVYSSEKWPQVGYFEFDQVEISTVYSQLKPYILFNSNGLAIWHGFPVIMHIEVENGSR